MNAEEFKNKFNELVGKIDNHTLAVLFKTSVPTIKRWKSGETAPHQLIMGSVFKQIAKTMGDKK